MLLSVLTELEQCKLGINELEEASKSLQTSLQYAHAEIEDLETKSNESQQQNFNIDQERIKKELSQRITKTTLVSRSGNGNLIALPKWFYGNL